MVEAIGQQEDLDCEEFDGKSIRPARQIVVGSDEVRVTDAAIDSLRDNDNIFQRGGMLVRVIRGAPPPKPLAALYDSLSVSEPSGLNGSQVIASV